MADVFTEHMVKRRSSPKTALIKLLIAAASALAALWPALALLKGVNLLYFLPLTAAGGFWFGRKLILRQNVEFEYMVTNGELDVDKILARRIRRHLLTVDCRSFITLAPCAPGRPYEPTPVGRRVDASSAPDSPQRWLVVFPGGDGVRTLLVFEPNEQMLDAFRQLNPGCFEAR